MRHLTSPLAVMLTFACLAGADARAWDKNEHRLLADSVYHSVMRECARPVDDTAYIINEDGDGLILPYRFWGQQTFGELCANAAADDLAKNRFHDHGKTVLEQLGSLTDQKIGESWRTVSEWALTTSLDADGPVILPSLAPTDNVIDTYLLYHLMGLHLVELHTNNIGQKVDRLRRALAFEAVAQGYLADAFSAAHILVDRTEPLAFLHRRNIREAHHYHSTRGAYVMNSQGDVWQTFGDELMHWYAPSYRQVYETCQSSMMELMAALYYHGGYSRPEPLEAWSSWAATKISSGPAESRWLSIVDGADYYLTQCMPTLQLLPMSVTATWSYRMDDKDEHGIRRHYHFPQFRDEGFHDSTLSESETEELHWRASLPRWFTPMPLRAVPPDDPDSLVQHHPDWASVRWTQRRLAPPSFKGVLLHIGGQLTHRDRRGLIGGLVGLGYGWWDDLVLVKNVSTDMVVVTDAADHDRTLLVSSLGFGLAAGDGWLKTVHFESGLAVDLRSDYDGVGLMLAVGLDSRVYSLRFTNAGITVRLKYQRLYLSPTLHGPTLQLILH